MNKSRDLISAIKKLEKIFGHDRADNILMGMVICKMYPHEIMLEIDKLIKNEIN